MAALLSHRTGGPHDHLAQTMRHLLDSIATRSTRRATSRAT